MTKVPHNSIIKYGVMKPANPAKKTRHVNNTALELQGGTFLPLLVEPPPSNPSALRPDRDNPDVNSPSNSRSNCKQVAPQNVEVSHTEISYCIVFPECHIVIP